MSKVQTMYISVRSPCKQENSEVVKNQNTQANDPVGITNKRQIRVKRRRKSPWDHTATEIFVNECVKQKLNFKKRSFSRYKIFHKIRFEMMAKGYNFDEESLNRKFRNLKIHLSYVRDRNNMKNAMRIRWPYFEKMAELFPLTKKRRNRVISSLHLAPTSQSSRSSESVCPCTTRKSPNRIRYRFANEMDRLRDEVIALEERRTIAVEQIAAELILANELARKQFELLKRRHEYASGYHNENRRRE